MHDLSPMLAERAGGTEPEAPKQRPLPSLVIDLHYKRIRAVLWTVTLTVLTLGAFCALWIWLYGGKTALGKMPFINLDSENGLGEWWSVLLLLIAAAFLAVNSLAEPNGRWKRHWLLLAAVFVFLSIDESIGIHESTMALMASYRLTGFFHFSWIIPYGIASIVLGLLFVSFVRVLPHKFRRRFVFAGALYLVAAMGMEGFGAYCATGGGTTPLNTARPCWPIAIVAEESGETIAITIFIVTLAMILAERCRMLAFNFSGIPVEKE